MPLLKSRRAKPGAANTKTRKPASSARPVETPSATPAWPHTDTIVGDMGLSGVSFVEPSLPATDTGSSSCEPTPPMLTRSIQDLWALAAQDIPADWTDELSESDRARLDRMRVALGLPDSRAMLVHLLRWLVIGHRTAWLGQPFGAGLRFWLDNVAY